MDCRWVETGGTITDENDTQQTTSRTPQHCDQSEPDRDDDPGRAPPCRKRDQPRRLKNDASPKKEPLGEGGSMSEAQAQDCQKSASDISPAEAERKAWPSRHGRSAQAERA